MLFALFLGCAPHRADLPAEPASPGEPAEPASPEEEAAAAPTAPAPVAPPPAPTGPVRRALTLLEPRSGSTVTGTVTFTEGIPTAPSMAPLPVHVVIDLKNAPPDDHGVHIHERGDCSAPDASSAGGHFNPDHTPHGDVTSAQRHPGDFGNVTVGPDGSGRKELDATGFTLAEGMHSANGLAVIVHESADDFSQPNGNAGARLACGVIVAEGQ